MNLYFVSLLKVDLERKKNVVCKYYLGDVANLLLDSLLERRTTIFNHPFLHLHVKSFKIRKVRYELILFLGDEGLDLDDVDEMEDEFSHLEDEVENEYNPIYKTTLNLRGENNDYLSKYKKRLFLKY